MMQYHGLSTLGSGKAWPGSLFDLNLINGIFTSPVYQNVSVGGLAFAGVQGMASLNIYISIDFGNGL